MVRWWTGVLPSPLPRQIDLTIIVVYTEILKSKKHSNPHPPPPPLHCNKPRTEVGKSLHLLRCPRHSRHKESLLSGTENLRNSCFSCWLRIFPFFLDFSLCYKFCQTAPVCLSSIVLRGPLYNCHHYLFPSLLFCGHSRQHFSFSVLINYLKRRKYL